MALTVVSRRNLVLAAGVSPLALAACREPGDAKPIGPEAAGVSAVAADRDVTQVVPSQPTSDGAGVKLRRALGHRGLATLDPFLMLDEFHSDNPADYAAGFPEHPHRGFETVTYMLEGAVEHRDSMGNHGRLGPGSVQWMTAGRGIVHSEMPRQQGGLMWGFQLWVNLPARLKMTRPRYQDLAAERVASARVGDAEVRVVAGEAGGARGPVEDIVTAPLMLDVKVPPGGAFRHPLPHGHTVFAYVIEGAVRLGTSGALVPKGNIVVFGPGSAVAASSEQGGRFLLLAGAPIGEPIVKHGPFVMNTQAEIQQAIDDYRTGRLVQRGG
jgi:quercetin 2,3-dioxygenase